MVAGTRIGVRHPRGSRGQLLAHLVGGMARMKRGRVIVIGPHRMWKPHSRHQLLELFDDLQTLYVCCRQLEHLRVPQHSVVLIETTARLSLDEWKELDNACPDTSTLIYSDDMDEDVSYDEDSDSDDDD